MVAYGFLQEKKKISPGFFWPTPIHLQLTTSKKKKKKSLAQWQCSFTMAGICLAITLYFRVAAWEPVHKYLYICPPAMNTSPTLVKIKLKLQSPPNKCGNSIPVCLPNKVTPSLKMKVNFRTTVIETKAKARLAPIQPGQLILHYRTWHQVHFLIHSRIKGNLFVYLEVWVRISWVPDEVIPALQQPCLSYFRVRTGSPFPPSLPLDNTAHTHTHIYMHSFHFSS